MLADHLVRQKHYTCVRWLCFANEPPGGTWGYWWSREQTMLPFRRHLKRCARPWTAVDWPCLFAARTGLTCPSWPRPKSTSRRMWARSTSTPMARPTRTSRASWETGPGGRISKASLFPHRIGRHEPWLGTTNPGPKSYEAVLSGPRNPARSRTLAWTVSTAGVFSIAAIRTANGNWSGPGIWEPSASLNIPCRSLCRFMGTPC